MPINSTLDVVIQQDDLVVLGPPTSVDISLDIGAQGDPVARYMLETLILIQLQLLNLRLCMVRHLRVMIFFLEMM